MTHFVKYLLITGEITCTGKFTEGNILDQLNTSYEGVIEGASNINTDYVDTFTKEILPKPVITAEPNKLTILADNTDLFRITGLPMPCLITVTNVGEYTVNDGEFGFVTSLKGVYTVTVDVFPYIPTIWEVVAV